MALTAKPVVKEKKAKSKTDAKPSTPSDAASTNGNRQPSARSRSMAIVSGNQLEKIEQLQRQLWDAADELRANSKLTANEYCMPCLGVIFLRHAANRYNEALRQIEADQAAGKMPKRRL